MKFLQSVISESMAASIATQNDAQIPPVLADKTPELMINRQTPQSVPNRNIKREISEPHKTKTTDRLTSPSLKANKTHDQTEANNENSQNIDPTLSFVEESRLDATARIMNKPEEINIMADSVHKPIISDLSNRIKETRNEADSEKDTKYPASQKAKESVSAQLSETAINDTNTQQALIIKADKMTVPHNVVQDAPNTIETGHIERARLKQETHAKKIEETQITRAETPRSRWMPVQMEKATPYFQKPAGQRVTAPTEIKPEVKIGQINIAVQSSSKSQSVSKVSKPTLLGLRGL